MKKKIKFADQTTREACIARLRAVADGLEAGTLGISHGNDALSLRPGSAFDVEVRAEQHNDRERLSLQLSWQPRTLPSGKRPTARAAESVPVNNSVDARDGEGDELPVSVEPATLRHMASGGDPGAALLRSM